jgi:type I restriction enzyme, S subunit
MSFPRYERYKDSGVEWLGEVPDGWELKPLWTLFRRTKRTGHPREELLSVYRDHGVVPKSSRDDNFNKPSDDLSVYQLVVAGDLVINKMKAWQGSVAITDYRGIVSPAYFTYEAIHHQAPRFLHHLMRSVRYITGYLSLSKGIRINQWDLEPQAHSRIPILIPSLPEQQAIASFLDLETAKIDGLIAEQENLIELLKEKRQAVISHAVTKGLNPGAPMKDSGVEWLGEVPEGWRVGPLKFFIEQKNGAIKTGPFGSQLTAQDMTHGSIKVYNQRNVIDVDFVGGENFISEKKFHELSSFETFPGDLLITTRGTIGRVAILPEDAAKGILHPCLIRVQPDSNEINRAFLKTLIQDSDLLRNQLAYQSNATTIDVIYSYTLASVVLPVPPLREQQAIVAFLDTETAKLDELTTEALRAIELLKERRSALISAAVTGKIDVRSAA